MAHPVSGLAASIRGATESETFDLAGSSAGHIETVIRDAFSEPLELDGMVRLTFVTGAGKLGRARYDEGAAKAVTSTLRELGYEEDRGASAVLECAGSFKLQHDTGKNLKTVVVFPKVTGNKASGGGLEKGVAGLQMDDAKENTCLPEDSVEHKIAHATMNVFPRMVESRCPSWSQKKGCVTAITDLKSALEELDSKLMTGTPLTETEQNFYDSVSMNSLEEKLACVKDLMHKQVDDGNITADEKRVLLSQVSDRLRSLATDIAKADKQSQPKRAENLRQAEEKAAARKEKLLKIEPRPPHRLKNEAEIAKLRTELVPLLEVENNAKGRLLTLKETQAVARKDEILEEIEQLEQASRGWFESDETFQARVEASREAWKAASKKKKPVGKKTSTQTGAWAVPKQKPARPKPPSTSNRKPASGGLFAAMMEDSDSD
jgi:hypothetical protein